MINSVFSSFLNTFHPGQVVEELHLAHSEKGLEVNVMQSCGDLTCMDTECSEERPADTVCEFHCFTVQI